MEHDDLESTPIYDAVTAELESRLRFADSLSGAHRAVIEEVQGVAGHQEQ